MNKNDLSQHKYSGFEDLLRAFAERDPSHAAIFCEKSGSPGAVSRKEFSDAVLSKSAALRPSTVSGTCFGILCDGSCECVEMIFASVLAGFRIVLLDENASEELLIEQIRETDITRLWGNDEDLIAELEPYLSKHTDRQADPEPSDAGLRDRPILFFTSGTTSRSKAVVLTDQSLMAAAYNGSCMLPLSSDDTLLCMLPLNHVFGFVCGLLWGMQCGAAVALGRGARYYAQDLSFFRPTALSAVPLLLGFILQHSLVNEELRLVLVGAGDCPPALLQSAMLKGLKISFGYGLTETSSGVAISVPAESASYDPYALEICPEDTVTLAPDGEILVESESCMMQGYYKRPEETAEVLRDGVLHTGDLGRWDENGRLRIIGRKKEILVLADGTKIFLPEYEARIAAALPGREFAVIGFSGRPVLLVVDENAESDLLTHLQAALRDVMEKLPRGQQISNILITNKPLPRTATGKIKRWELSK